MTTAEEVADNILWEICQYIPDSKEQERYFKSIRRCLDRELTAYAEERVANSERNMLITSIAQIADDRAEAYEVGKADGKLALDQSYERGRRHARAEALEEMEQKLKEARDYCERACKRVSDATRSDTLEEAAKVVQKWIDNNCVGPNPANLIRALIKPKEKPWA